MTSPSTAAIASPADPEAGPAARPARGAHAFRSDLERLLRAHVPLIQVHTVEESRALDLIQAVAAGLGRHCLAWSASRGVFRPSAANSSRASVRAVADLAAGLQHFEQSLGDEKVARDGALFLLFDPYPYLTDRTANPAFRRRLRDMAADIRKNGWKASCVIVSPVLDMPIELSHDVTVVSMPLPTRSEIRTYVRNFINRVGEHGRVSMPPDREALAEQFAEAAIGLTQIEIENALSYAVVDDFRFDRADIAQIFRQKRQIVRKSGLLEFIDTDGLSLDQVGGLDRLKLWLGRRRATLTREGREFGLPVPKGVLLTGVPGCGKSWSAKCAAAAWDLPLIRLDMGRVYASLVGASEENMRHAIQVAETVAPCVLWIDEIEKGLMRPAEHIGDSGVSMRVLGTFLTWMQEKKSAVFVFATANEMQHLPPEILRRGRFDGVFFVDLPNAAERREVLAIHLARIGRLDEGLDLDALVALSGGSTMDGREGMTGAEIAAWIDDALLLAYDRSRRGEPPQLRLADFEAAMTDISTISGLRPEELSLMRLWAESHARPATTSPS